MSTPAHERAATTRPTVLGHLLHDRGIRFAAGLAVVVAIPVAVLFYFQVRSLNDLEQTSAVVLRQLSGDTADAMTREIENALKRPHIDILLRTNLSRTEPPDYAFIDAAFEEGLAGSPFIEELWLWSETHADDWLVYDHRSLLEPADAVERRFRRAPERLAALLPRVRELSAQKRAIVAFPATVDGRQKYIQVQMRFESIARERMTSFVGFSVDAERLRTEFFPALLEARLAAVQQPTGFPPLQLNLVDGHGRPVLPAGATELRSFVDERTFPLVFFDRELLEYAAPYEQQRETWRVRTGYGDQTIAAIVDASTRPQMAVMILLAVAMAFGVFLVAGAAAREVRVAELKSNFVASVSHDLKTPLALIQLFAETLELGRVRSTERTVEYYRIINSEARKLTRLIENILDFSRMEAGLRPYRTVPADVGALTAQVLSRMDNQFSQNQFTVSARIEPDLPRVLVDHDAVEQAIENLLNNAMKYSGESRAIEVDVRRRNGHVEVAVTDHGIGIPRREQKKIFRKFYRVDRELGGGPQGCGLGLAIVDHTMRGHGGFVGVDSEPERGSTFTLHFPVPARDIADGEPHEAHSGDRGRAADAARPA
ncbi:MAG: HAMP domain-containing sensor histidine kinase [Acidobacteriota bacterium]